MVELNLNYDKYGVKVLEKGSWIDEGKYQYRTDVGHCVSLMRIGMW